MFKKIFREFYLLTRGEQRAWLLLAALLILALVSRLVVSLLPGRIPPGQEKILKEAKELITAYEMRDSISRIQRSKPAYTSSGLGELTLSVFNPNEIGFESLIRMGLPQRFSNNLIKYREAGGFYATTGDMEKIYGLTPGLLDQLKPFLVFPSSVKHSKDKIREDGWEGPAAVEINQADSLQLLCIPGVGPVFAGRIIKYRKLLGGFLYFEQLAEVYGMQDETVQLIRSFVNIDSTYIRKININSASYVELLRHPYLDRIEVEALLEYREFSGQVHSVSEIRENQLLPDSILEKVSSYLDFDH